MRGTMLAAVYCEDGICGLKRRPVPEIQQPRDVLVRVTRSSICQSDLHILHGAVPKARPGIILGHEFVGVVEQVGSGIAALQPGDRVAANCETFCGECWFCKRGYINNCRHGGWMLGCQIDGCQAEYVRVPFGDMGLTKLPDCLTDEDALFVGDILSSGYFGAELCEIKPGDVVVVLGAGPVGLCAAQCARLFGAGRVVCIDLLQSRLALALKEGLADSVLEAGREDLAGALLVMTQGRGADAVIEAAGGISTFQTAWQLARPNAVVALVAMYEREQMLPLPQMYGKNLIFKTGGVDARHCSILVDLLAKRQLRTNFLITNRMRLENIAEAYEQFAFRRGEELKWVINHE